MNTLLVWPKFAPSFFSLTGVKELIGKNTIYAPLGLVTIASILPQDWNFKIADCNVAPITEADWQWAEIIMVSGMITQRIDQGKIIEEAKQRNKMVAVGGPFATSMPDEPKDAGADFLILDEGELTIPLFLEALKRGETSGTFTANGEKADMTQSPMPRFDLLNFTDYLELSVQFSRGCPFLCEFCDIPVLFGRKPRTKAPEQVVAELERLVELGWNRTVMLADDNFIGHKKNAIAALRVIKQWQVANEYPLNLSTEATLNLADDPKLMQLLKDAGVRAIFVGIETPDVDSLAHIKKKQNIRHPMIDRIRKTQAYGFRLLCGFIIGFDGEKPGADKRIFDFVEKASIPIVMVNLLFALPNTPLTKRLQKQNRFKFNTPQRVGELPNFVLTRPLEEVIDEYVNCLKLLYDPKIFIRRLKRNCLMMGEGSKRKKRKLIREKFEVRAAFILLWRHGAKRESRWLFWSALIEILWKNPSAFRRYISCCGEFEHHLAYGQSLKQQLLKDFEELGDHRFDVYTPPPGDQSLDSENGTKVTVNTPVAV